MRFLLKGHNEGEFQLSGMVCWTFLRFYFDGKTLGVNAASWVSSQPLHVVRFLVGLVHLLLIDAKTDPPGYRHVILLLMLSKTWDFIQQSVILVLQMHRCTDAQFYIGAMFKRGVLWNGAIWNH